MDMLRRLINCRIIIIIIIIIIVIVIKQVTHKTAIQSVHFNNNVTYLSATWRAFISAAV